ncbi:MAG TPA: PfkB family carbohydrate kinase [Trichocoleus sp.]
MGRGLFVGLVTLDCIYQVEHVPASDEKLVASDSLLVAGGPATNAAVAFRYLGNSAAVMGVLGQHAVGSLIRADLTEQKVILHDLMPNRVDPPPLSTILVTTSTGERAVVSRNAVNCQASSHSVSESCLEDVDVVLLDGHQMAIGVQIARWASSRNIPIIIDAGSWKLGFEEMLPLATYVIASARFFPPHCSTQARVLDYLIQLGVPAVAITQGQQPILYGRGQLRATLPVPTVPVKDTLGAGDIFHGAFCHYCLQHPFEEALIRAAAIAAQSCQSFGTRTWMQQGELT